MRNLYMIPQEWIMRNFYATSIHHSLITEWLERHCLNDTAENAQYLFEVGVNHQFLNPMDSYYLWRRVVSRQLVILDSNRHYAYDSRESSYSENNRKFHESYEYIMQYMTGDTPLIVLKRLCTLVWEQNYSVRWKRHLGTILEKMDMTEVAFGDKDLLIKYLLPDLADVIDYRMQYYELFKAFLEFEFNVLKEHYMHNFKASFAHIKDDLMQEVWHPKRVSAMIDKHGIDILDIV